MLMSLPQVTALANKIKDILNRKAGLQSKGTRIVPANDATNRPLLGVIAIMCYFAALAGESVLMINRAVDEWTSGLSSAITIQVRPVAGDTALSLDTQIGELLKIVRAAPGVTRVQELSRRDTEKLLEPWLGAGNILDELPIPRLIDVQIDRAHPPEMELLSLNISRIAPNAKLNDHAQWNDRILIFANFLRGLAFGILILTIITTITIVLFATRAGLTAKHEIVEVLHLTGAHDAFIAREFEKQFMSLGLRAGLLAIAAALLTFLLFSGLISRYANAEIYFLPTPDLYFSDFLLLLLIPLGAALVATLTTRVTVLRVIGRTL